MQSPVPKANPINPALKSKPDLRWWALLGLLALVAHASLFGVGPVGEDFRILAETSRAVNSELGGKLGSLEDLFAARAGSNGRPLAALSLAASAWLWTSGGVWTHAAIDCLRFENLALLLIVAILLSRFLKRLASPWVGQEQAAAAGQAALLMLVVHPLSINAVASPLARGDLLGAALAFSAAVSFLHGRQSRRFALVALALPLTFAASLASEMAYLLPILLAGSEYFCARRYRPGRVRLRTALTTLVVFAGALGLDVALRLVLGVEPWPMQLENSLVAMTQPGDLWLAILHGLTKLGVLIVPVNGANAGGLGFVLAALLIVIVVKPALHAGRSAPRFWLTVLCSWLGMVILTEATRADLQVGPSDLSAAAGLFPAVVVMAMGMALASTAVSGSRRQALPIIVACLFCTLSRSNARGWRSAAKHAGELSLQGAPLLLEQAHLPRVLVLKAPDMVDLYAACPKDLSWMFDEAISGVRQEATGQKLQALSQSALLTLARTPEFDAWRRTGLAVVFQQHLVERTAEERWVVQSLTRSAASKPVLAWLNPELSQANAHWVAAAESTPSFADPADLECLTAHVAIPIVAEDREPASSVEVEAPVIYWRARGGVVHGGELHGVWLLDGAGRTAVFDPSSDLAWLLGQEVDSLMLMGELAGAGTAEVWPAAPALPGFSGPSVDGDDWFLGSPKALRYLAAGQQETWILSLLDLLSLKLVEVECSLDDKGELLASDAERLSQSLRSEPGSLAWGLERHVGDLVLQRMGGRF